MVFPTTAKIDLSVGVDPQGLDLERQASALARAEMRSNTPSAKVAARAVRSLKKKLARIREWEIARESGKDLSSEQVDNGAKPPRYTPVKKFKQMSCSGLVFRSSGRPLFAMKRFFFFFLLLSLLSVSLFPCNPMHTLSLSL